MVAKLNMEQLPPGTPIRYNPEHKRSVLCAQCHKDQVQPVFKIFKVSALANATGQDIFITEQYWKCVKCRKIWKEELA